MLSKTKNFLSSMSRPTNDMIDIAGITLSNSNITMEVRNEAFNTLNTWRTLHYYPMNTFQATLRQRLKKCGIENALIAQRLKRSTTMVDKLTRKQMNLSEMRDVGGLRVIVDNISDVRKIEELYLNSKWNHFLSRHKDYITNSHPTKSGYRGIHLIYTYNNPSVPDYKGLHIELQIRTKLQHIWATAVETAGTSIGNALKSSQGSEEWLKFFTTISYAFTYIENSTPLPNTSKQDTFAEVIRLADSLKVKAILRATLSVEPSMGKYSAYSVITLDSTAKTVKTEGFSKTQLEEATKRYADIENDISGQPHLNVVLVSVGVMKKLKKAYPNYFLDTTEFIEKLDFIRRQSKLNPPSPI